MQVILKILQHIKLIQKINAMLNKITDNKMDADLAHLLSETIVILAE